MGRQNTNTKISWSPSFTNEDFPELFNDWTLEDKVRLFKDQVLGWQLQVANDIINIHGDDNPHAGFAVLSILLNYFEMIGKYIQGYEGDRQSEAHFKIGLIAVIPELENKERAIDILYQDARCGMYHEALIGKRILLTRNYNVPIHIVDEYLPIIAIDPHSLTTHLITHFIEYIQRIQSTELEDHISQNFQRRFDFLKRHKVSIQSRLDIND